MKPTKHDEDITRTHIANQHKLRLARIIRRMASIIGLKIQMAHKACIKMNKFASSSFFPRFSAYIRFLIKTSIMNHRTFRTVKTHTSTEDQLLQILIKIYDRFGFRSRGQGVTCKFISSHPNFKCSRPFHAELEIWYEFELRVGNPLHTERYSNNRNR